MKEYKIVKEERYIPCKTCLVITVCHKLCPEVEEMLNEDMKPILEEMERVLRETHYGGSV
jgi:sulfatase maturation enzyme AslB (radical SAM superfamily)